MTNVAKALKAIRKQKGWTQQQLADRTGLGRSTIGCIESQQHNPGYPTVVLLAWALGVPPARLTDERAERVPA